MFSKKPSQNDKLTWTPEPYLQIGTVLVKPRRMVSLVIGIYFSNTNISSLRLRQLCLEIMFCILVYLLALKQIYLLRSKFSLFLFFYNLSDRTPTRDFDFLKIPSNFIKFKNSQILTYYRYIILRNLHHSYPQ